MLLALSILSSCKKEQDDQGINIERFYTYQLNEKTIKEDISFVEWKTGNDYLELTFYGSTTREDVIKIYLHKDGGFNELPFGTFTESSDDVKFARGVLFSGKMEDELYSQEGNGNTISIKHSRIITTDQYYKDIEFEFTTGLTKVTGIYSGTLH